MSIDLSWIWDWLGGVVDTINSFFQSLWSQIQNITNTGQGLFAGLSALGSMLWDSLKAIGDALGNFASQVYNFGEWIYKGVTEGVQWIFKAIGNIGTALYSAFQWLWNGIYWIGQQITTFFVNVWNWLASTLSNLSQTFNTWISGIRDSVNTWWTNLVKTFRNKLKVTVLADLSISMTWKAFEKAFTDPSTKSLGMALLSPFIAPVLGQMVASMVDSVVPIPQTENFELIPPVNVPSITIPELTVPVVSPPAPPREIGLPAIGYGLPYDVELVLPSLAYETTTRTVDGSLSLPVSSYDTDTSPTDGSLSLPTTSYETAVA